MRNKSSALIKSQAPLLGDIRQLILATRERVAQAVNASLVILYWQVGQRIRKDVLKEKRAEYGEDILQTLSAKLAPEFGRGFSQRNLASMVRFAAAFPDPKIMHALSAKLSWSHFVQIVYLDDPLKRDFYSEMCRIEGWSTRTLQRKIGSMLFERTALSRKPAKLAELELKALRDEDRLSPDLVFRDPYLLDFLGLKDTYAEKDLEAAILREIEAFILELGVGFAFVERQKRITVDGEDFYLDLLFYHRHLRRLVGIDLKLEDFKPADMGQMELYLRWLDRYERKEGEEKPIGLILCAGKKSERVELLDLERRGIRVASYWTAVLPKKELQRKLHEAVRLARANLHARQTTAEGLVPAKSPTKPKRREK
jgi:predicted nuclease of restriction endonuclease-like (RecB) superfamily